MNKLSSSWVRVGVIVAVSTVIAALPLAGGIWMLNSSNSAQHETAHATEKAVLVKSWKTIIMDAGSGKKRTPLFRLLGGQQTLKYTVQGAFDPSLTVYIVPENGTTDDVEPEVLNATKDGETSLFKPAGLYYLETRATGSSWSVEVAELQL